MTPKQLAKYIDAMWEKYGHPDRHGYKDFMYPDGFESAVREALQDFGVDVKTAKPKIEAASTGGERP